MCKISRLREVEIIIKTTHVFVVFFTTYILYFHFLGHLAELPYVPGHQSTINSMRFSQFPLLLGLEKGWRKWDCLKKSNIFAYYYIFNLNLELYNESKMIDF